MYCQSKVRWRFCKILWPSQNIWTLFTWYSLAYKWSSSISFAGIFIQLTTSTNFTYLTKKKNMLLLFNQYFIMAQDSLFWQSRFAQFWQDFAAKALLLVNRTELEIFWQKPYFWSFLLPELEIFWQDFAAKALVLVNPTKVEIFWQNFAAKP